MTNTGLDSRMKEYEYVNRMYLPKRTPVIIRLDGKAFHTFTKNFTKPFDNILIEAMKETAKYLCKNIMNCKLAYIQSDEISLLLINYNNINSESWFNNNIQKMVSVSASMATMEFNRRFKQLVCDTTNNSGDSSLTINYSEQLECAMFDSRVFVLPQDEVCNYFVWRQQDATKNSIQMVAQSLFPHSELQSLNGAQLQEKLWQEKNVNWNALPTQVKRGSCVKKENCDDLDNSPRWKIDSEIPIFTADRDYIEKFVYPNIEKSLN